MEWDVFISHASEDKNEVALPLRNMLIERGLNVWFDEVELSLGDSLRAKIDYGLARSQYGVVILSKAFFSKNWTQRELSGLVARESNVQKVVIPIWHGVNHEFVARYSPLLADRFAIRTSTGLEQVASKIAEVVRNESNSSLKLISYDLLGSTLVTLGVAKWTPKILRLGLEWDIVTEDSGHIKFSEPFIANICEVSRDWLTTQSGRFLKKDWFYEQVILAVIRTAPKDSLPVTLDDLVDFVPGIMLHLVSYVFEVGQTSQVMEGYIGGKFELNREFTDELQKIVELRVNEISSVKKVRPFMFKTFLDLARSRLILYDKEHINHAHLLVVVVALLFYKDVIKKMESIFKTDKRRDEIKGMS